MLNQDEWVIAQLDELGAHFKYKDICGRLRVVITDRLQEKRSSDLMAYQQYFTQNEPLKLASKQNSVKTSSNLPINSSGPTDK